MMRNRPEFLEVQGARGPARRGRRERLVAVDARGARVPRAALRGERRSSSRRTSGTSSSRRGRASAAIARGLHRRRRRRAGRLRTGTRKTSSRRAERVCASTRNVSEDAAVVIYTSGTTGKPKGAVRKFPKDAMHARMQFIGETPMRSDDVHLVTCPLYHSTAFGFLAFTALLAGRRCSWTSSSPRPFSQLVERHGVTTTAVVPTILHRVMALGPDVLAKYDVRSMRGIFTVGAPLPAPLGTQVMDHFGDVLFNCYGATETGLVTHGQAGRPARRARAASARCCRATRSACSTTPGARCRPARWASSTHATRCS